VVARLTVAVTAAVPLGVTELGEMEQVVPATAPVHVRLAEALKPPLGVRLSVVEAVLPGSTDVVVEESEMVKLGVGAAVMVTAIAGAEVEAKKDPADPG
jgi:hypothetical protein